MIDRAVSSYVIGSSATIREAIKAIDANRSRIIFAVETDGSLIGSISDGDIRRWLSADKILDLEQPVYEIANKQCVKHNVNDNPDLIRASFSSGIELIPIVDSRNRIYAIAKGAEKTFRIRDTCIGQEYPVFTICEIGNNHQGDLITAKKLVDVAAEAGADCVKFQMRNMQTLYGSDICHSIPKQDLGCQYALDLLYKYQLSDDDLYRIFDYANKKGIIPLCTPWDHESAIKLEIYGIDAYKVSSADLTNNYLIKQLADTGRPLICSTGMSSESEIKGLTEYLKRIKAQFALLHCNSTYPTPYKDINLLYIRRLAEISGAVVGYSGHERGFTIPLAAVALGAQIIEKHVTFNRSQEGADHKVSLLPEEFKQMVSEIRNVRASLGTSEERLISQGEMINRENLAKSIVAATEIREGETITEDKLSIVSPGLGIQPNRIHSILGTKAKRSLCKGEFFYESDIINLPQKKTKYIFDRPYGIPVRYHDCQILTDGMEIDFVEFHLSYNDLLLSPEEYLKDILVKRFTVHAPELYANDHILDLASGSESYREESIKNLRSVIEATRKLKNIFGNPEPPVLVLNAGGWSTDSFIIPKERIQLYNRVLDSLRQVDHRGIRIAIQTMPPFPWHRGGQSFHNLFVCPEEIREFCLRSEFSICVDVSHSHMACTYYQWDFEKFMETVLPYTIHLHISDATGIDGEGVKMGKGEIDFESLQQILSRLAPQVQFIPEIWQGHKDKGQGFWEALQFLESHNF